jgi:hypothetical protein
LQCRWWLSRQRTVGFGVDMDDCAPPGPDWSSIWHPGRALKIGGAKGL